MSRISSEHHQNDILAMRGSGHLLGITCGIDQWRITYNGLPLLAYP